MATKMNWDMCRGKQVMIHSSFLNQTIGLYSVEVRIGDRQYRDEPDFHWTISRCGSHLEAFNTAMARVASIMMVGRLTVFGKTYRTFTKGRRSF